MNSTNEILVKPPQSEVPSASALEAARARTTLRRAGIVALVLVVAGAVAGLIPRWHQRALLQTETRELAQQTVQVVLPKPSTPAGGLTLPAEVKPLIEAPIYARASGYLTNWYTDLGARVKEGELLAEIDTPELTQELIHSRAELAQAEAALKLAETTAKRWTELLKTASVSEQEEAEKLADLELKRANVDAARATVGRLEQLQSFAKVTAPFNGIITARLTDIGQLVNAGSGRELFRLAQIDKLRVFVQVPQNLAREVAPGQMAELLVPEWPGRVFPAKVVRNSGAVSADSRTQLTELEVDNVRHEILAGTFAQVRFTEAKQVAALTLPSNTLLFRSEGTQVGVVGSDGKVELRKVTVGRDFGPTIEIVAGVSANDEVILNPPDSLVGGVIVHKAGGGSAAVAEK